MHKITKNKDNIILVLMVLLHTLALFVILNFTKAIETYPDELAYYNIAKSLFYNNGVKMHGVSFPLQNLAYSYFLLPFFGIKNGVIRVSAITLANSFIMSACIIPIWGICKELNLKKLYRWLIVAIMLVWPDLIISGTFMSENLFWFLSLITFYFCIKTYGSKNIVWSIMAAIGSYLTYFCKEVALCFPIAYVGALVITPCINLIIDRKDDKGTEKINVYKEYRKSEIFKKLVVYLITYIIMYILFKKTILLNIDDIYKSKMDISFLKDWYSIFYFAYAFAYYFIASALAFMVYPLIYPAIHIRELDKKTKNAFLFLMLLFLETLFVIVFTITIKEDVGRVAPRIHLRYFTPMIGVFLPIFFKAISLTQNIRENKFFFKKYTYLWIIFGVICAFLYKGITLGSTNESYALFFSKYLADKFPALCHEGDKTVVFYPYAVIIIVLLVFVFALLHFFEKSFSEKKFLMLFSIIMIGVCVLNVIPGTIFFERTYIVREDLVKEMEEINNYFRENNIMDSRVAFVAVSPYDEYSRVYDTYFDGENNYEINNENIVNIIAKTSGTTSVDKITFNDIIDGKEYNIDRLDYIICSSESEENIGIIQDFTKVESISKKNYSVYKNINAYEIKVNRTTSFDFNFTSSGNNTAGFVKGISSCEDDYTWSDGNNLEISCFLKKNIKKVKVDIDLKDTFNGKQQIYIYQGDTEIYEGEANGGQMISFELIPIEGDCSFRVFLPNAISPSQLGQSMDTRNLALALRNINIKKFE